MAMDEVAQIVFISRDEALADFRLQLGDDADLLDALETNPLPNSFWVTPQEQHKNKTSMAYLAGKIIQLEGVEDVRYGKDFLERFTAIIKGIYYVDIIVGLIVIISAIFIISNAVRLTVISRKRNIKILKLVGATNRFITMPFIIEGALQGGIAAFVSLVLVFGVTIAARQVVPDLQYFSLQKATIYMFVCVAIGSIGSFAALRRYLKV
jgi:cell division transport system permease protein